MGYYQENQHTHYGSLRRKKREKGAERLFQEIMAKIFLYSMKDMNINI